MKKKVANAPDGMTDKEQEQVFSEVMQLAQDIERVIMNHEPSVVMSALMILAAHGIRQAQNPIDVFAQTVTALHVNLMNSPDRKEMH